MIIIVHVHPWYAIRDAYTVLILYFLYNSQGIVQNCVNEMDCGCGGLCRPAHIDWSTYYKRPDEEETV